MPFTPFTFDDSVGRTEEGRARVPEGYYKVVCEGFEPTAEDYAKTTGVFAKVRILEGPAINPGQGVGGRLRDFNSLGKAEAQFGLGQCLGALGLEPIAKQLAQSKMAIDTYAKFLAFAQNLSRYATGKEAVVLIADQPGQTRPFSGIEEWHKASDWDNYRQAQTVGGGGQPPANGPVGAVTPPRGPAPSMAAASDLFADLDAELR